jgi:uncharacterized protein
MRLTPLEQQVIREETKNVFGEDAKVFLFGSRADDSKLGGDIDLFIEVVEKTDLPAKKTKFLSKVKWRTEDQRIDVVFNEDPSRLIEQEARKWGVLI